MTTHTELLRHGAAVLLALGFVIGATPAAGQDAVAAELKLRVEQLRDAGSATLGRPARNASVLVDLYEARGFVPLWTDAGRSADLVHAVRGAADDGLDPSDYHLAVLEAGAAPTGAVAAAELELVRSDALLGLVRDLKHGKVDPATVADGLRARPISADELIADVERIAASGRIAERVAALRPTHFVYTGLLAALADLRLVAAQGGWERVGEGPTLRAGSVDPRLPALRRRLARAGDLPARAATGDSLFDAVVEAAVTRFQHRHGLNADGVLGPATLRELDTPVERRIDQVRVNLERARWVAHELPETFVVVNIAGARAYLVRSGDPVFETKVVVGRTQTRTPVFRAMLRYIDLNPTWTVPPGIVGEVLAEIRRDPGYLRRMDMSVLDRGGHPVDVTPVALARHSAAGFPYVFRQEPGPRNPLGQVKFVFPNPYHVYLHDTPSRALFEREQRTFSHGCIRVQNPLRLAELILNDPVRWDRARLDATIATGRTRTIPLLSPIPVLILYWTAAADPGGEPRFYRDVYGRDAAVLRALDRP